MKDEAQPNMPHKHWWPFGSPCQYSRHSSCADELLCSRLCIPCMTLPWDNLTKGARGDVRTSLLTRRRRVVAAR
jgi:hypothetical protein